MTKNIKYDIIVINKDIIKMDNLIKRSEIKLKIVQNLKYMKYQRMKYKKYLHLIM